MKKVLGLGISLLLLITFVTGCSTSLDTPTSKVEEFLGKYQSMDSDVLTQLDSVVASDTDMTEKQKEDYKALMEKQYQNLSYKIVDETIDGDNATVDVEIEVFDYATSINESKNYYEEHKTEFEEKTKSTVNEEDARTTKDNEKDDTNIQDNDGNDSDDDNDDIENNTNKTNTEAYLDYKISEMKNVKDKVKYTITFNLVKEDNKWKVQDISDLDRQKIHGLYNS